MSLLNIQRYTHVPLYVQAVRVTEDNFDAAVVWSEGKADKNNKGEPFIRVSVINPKTPRHEKAMLGDWILKTSVGLKVYVNSAFQRSFVLAPE